VPSRLPFRKKVCPECGGTGHVTPTGREKLLKKDERRSLPVSGNSHSLQLGQAAGAATGCPCRRIRELVAYAALAYNKARRGMPYFAS